MAEPLRRAHALVAAELAGRRRTLPARKIVVDANHHHLAVPVFQEDVAARHVGVERPVGVVLLVEVEDVQVDDRLGRVRRPLPFFGIFLGREEVLAVVVHDVGVGRIAVELRAGRQQQHAAFEPHAHGQRRAAVVLVGLRGEVQRQAFVVDDVVQFADDIVHALVVGAAGQVHLDVVAVEVAGQHLVAQQHAGTVLAQEVVVEPGAQEAGFVLVLFDHERTARRVVEHLLVVADVLDEVGGRTDAAVEVAPEFVVVRRGAPIAEVYLVGVVVLAVVGDVQVVRAGIPRNGARAMGFVQNVAVNGGEVFLRIGSALEDLFDGDSVVGHLIEEVVVAGGQAGGRSQREQCYFEFHG